MRSEDEIKKRIANIKEAIYEDVVSGLYADRLLQEHSDWINCLEWVLKEQTNEK